MNLNSTSLEDLQLERNQVVNRMAALRDTFKSRGDDSKGQPGKWQGDESEQWSRLNADCDAISKRMGQLRDSRTIENQWNSGRENERRSDINSAGSGRPNQETRDLAFQGWLCSQMDGELGESQRQAMEEVRLSPTKSRLDVPLSNTRSYRAMQNVARSSNRNDIKAKLETRAMGSTATNGAEFIPEGFVNMVEINQLAYSGTLQACDIVRTNGGGDLPWPTMDDTSNKGALVAESGSIATDTDPATSSVTMKAFKFTSKAVLVPYELLEDAALAPDLQLVLADALAERLGRIKEQYYTTGTGSAQPQGIVTASALGVTTASTTAIAADDIIKMEHSVDPAYRNGAAYMMNDSVLLAVRLLKDSEGRYLWQPGLQDGIPDRLNGRQVFVNQEMESALTAAKKVMLFGQFAKHKIREVNSMRLYRLTERYRDSDQDGFVAFCRGDSRLLNAGTAPIKHLITAAS